MNRAERRQHMRRALKGENVVAMPTGEKIAIDDITMRELPVKREGAHRWIATAGFTLTNPSAVGPKMLDHNNMFVLAIGCYDCEQPWSADLDERPCPGDPNGDDR